MGYYLDDLKIATIGTHCGGLNYSDDIVLYFPNISIDCDIVDVWYRNNRKRYRVGIFELVLSLIEHEITHRVIESICDENISDKLDCINLELERMLEYIEDNI